MIPRAFPSVLEKYEWKYQEERTATLESLFSKQLELFVSWDELSWPENGANNAKVVSLIPQWAIQWRVGIDDPCGPFHLKIFCESAIMFNFWFVYPSHENHISIKYWPEAQNVSASALKKRVQFIPREVITFSQNNLSTFYFNPLVFLALQLTELCLGKDRSGKLLIQVSSLWSFRW